MTEVLWATEKGPPNTAEKTSCQPFPLADTVDWELGYGENRPFQKQRSISQMLTEAEGQPQ